jgi:hypothetical protein
MWCWKRMEEFIWTDHVGNKVSYYIVSMGRVVTYVQ